MTALYNNFEGGPHGTVLTVGNSSQSGQDAFDVVSTQAANAILQFKEASALGRSNSEFVLHCKTGATSAAEGVGWGTSLGTQTQVWMRMYLRLDILPSGLNVAVFECDNGAAFTGSIEIQGIGTPGRIKIWNGLGTVSAITTNSIVAGEWCRIEAWFKYSTTVGEAQLQLYLEPDSDTPSDTVSFSGANSGGANSNSWAFGYPFMGANQPNLFLSAIELNNEGWPGSAPFIVKGVPGIQPSAVAIHNW